MDALRRGARGRPAVLAVGAAGNGRRATALPDGTSKREGKSLETQGKILDAAEELFSVHGLYGVTLRDIAAKAEVDTALLHYYFQSKDNMFTEVIARRGALLMGECMAELDAYEASDGEKTVEGIIAAYLRPVFQRNRNGGKGWRNFCAVILRLSNSPDWASDVISEYFDPAALRVIAMLKAVMPGCNEVNLYWGHQMFTRVMTLTSAPKGRMERLSDGRCKASDYDAMEPLIVKFTAEGLRGICGMP